MGATKRYLRDQFRLKKCGLEHEEASDFYLSSWQSNHSALPLLCLRLILFLGCIGILVSSLVLVEKQRGLQLWAIHMTQWCVMLIVIITGLGFAVSARAYFGGPIYATFGLPWYVKLFWATYSIGVSITFMGTVVYYSLLYAEENENVIYPILDLFVHGINSVLMFTLLITARQPTHFLHVIYVYIFVIVYFLFTIIYYFAGGLSPWGDRYIYPILDWSKPGDAIAFMCVYLIVLPIIHTIPVLMSVLRDYLSLKYVRRDFLPTK